MKDSGKLDILVELVHEVRSDLKDIKETQVRQGVDLSRNTDSLEEHIRRTNLLEDDLQLHVETDNKRFEKLEAPQRAKKMIIDWLMKMGAGIGIFWSILQIMDWFKK